MCTGYINFNYRQTGLFSCNILQINDKKMNLNEDSNKDEYFITAVKIFDYCGVNSTATLPVDALIDKFAPFMKTNNFNLRAEYNYLKSLLDPEESNPEITVSTLTIALKKYSESQMIKVDLEESFNLKNGQAPHDCDSGISTDGFQLLEELQCELKEKAHLVQQLRSQLDFNDRQHEEALATVTAERDSFKVHLNTLREENGTLSHARQDYEEAYDRLCTSEKELEDARRELKMSRKCTRVLKEQVSHLESEKLTLQELLTKSKDECHRINEMYASRQSALLEENETLKAEHAKVLSCLQNQKKYMQQVEKEKDCLEMELKDICNKSNQNHLRMDRSIDVSFTDDQVLTDLDSLNADSRFAPENQVLGEESFDNALKEDQGRETNMSLFDELRLSDRHNPTELNCSTNTEKKFINNDTLTLTVSTQTEHVDDLTCSCYQTVQAQATQIDALVVEDEEHANNNNNNNIETCMDCTKCVECEKLREYVNRLKSDIKHKDATLSEIQSAMDGYEENLDVFQKSLEEEANANRNMMTLIAKRTSGLNVLVEKCLVGSENPIPLYSESVEVQTESDYVSVSTQANIPCISRERQNAITQNSSLRRYFWEPLKRLFQLFAVVCFLFAVYALYGVTRRRALCGRQPLPWRWFDPQDLLDFLLRIDYLDEVPM